MHTRWAASSASYQHIRPSSTIKIVPFVLCMYIINSCQIYWRLGRYIGC